MESNAKIFILDETTFSFKDNNKTYSNKKEYVVSNHFNRFGGSISACTVVDEDGLVYYDCIDGYYDANKYHEFLKK